MLANETFQRRSFARRSNVLANETFLQVVQKFATWEFINEMLASKVPELVKELLEELADVLCKVTGRAGAAAPYETFNTKLTRYRGPTSPIDHA